MVLEFIFTSFKLKHRPFLIMFEAMFLTFLSVFVVSLLFPGQAYSSIAVLAFITIGAVPVFNDLYSKTSYISNYNKPFFTRHKSLIQILGFFFIGVFISFIILYFVLTPSFREDIFSTQIGELKKVYDIRSAITGDVTLSNSTPVTPYKFQTVFGVILANNLNVVLSSILLSFFYGAGAIFLICWNASMLAGAIALEVSLSLSAATASGISLTLIGIWQTILSVLSYVFHGVPEIAAYLIVSFAGAMLSRDLLKGLFTTEFKNVAIMDIARLIAMALICLLIGALIEASYFIK
ncbi:MAG: stage II sporulation protein M [archaeon]